MATSARRAISCAGICSRSGRSSDARIAPEGGPPWSSRAGSWSSTVRTSTCSGTREPAIYGAPTLDEIDASLSELAKERGGEVEFFQSNHEGSLIDRIQEAPALGRRDPDQSRRPDAHECRAARRAGRHRLPVVEVHLSNVFAREAFRQPLARLADRAGGDLGLRAGAAIGSVSQALFDLLEA